MLHQTTKFQHHQTVELPEGSRLMPPFPVIPDVERPGPVAWYPTTEWKLYKAKR